MSAEIVRPVSGPDKHCFRCRGRPALLARLTERHCIGAGLVSTNAGDGLIDRAKSLVGEENAAKFHVSWLLNPSPLFVQ